MRLLRTHHTALEPTRYNFKSTSRRLPSISRRHLVVNAVGET